MQAMGVPGFLKKLAITGSFLLLVVHGAGRYSLDARRG